jgi:hypothetical protein
MSKKGILIQSEGDLERQVNQLSALYTTSLEINAKQNLSALLPAIVEGAAGLLGASLGGLYLVDASRQTLHLVVSYNLPENYQGNTLLIGQSLSGRVALQGQPDRKSTRLNSSH